MMSRQIVQIIFLLFISVCEIRGAWDLMRIFNPQRTYAYQLQALLLPMLEHQKICNQKGGRLATIESDRDEEKIKKMGMLEDAFIGLTDMKKEGVFVWFGNNKMDLQRHGRFWFKGEPNNFQDAEDCATVMKRGGKGPLIMNDNQCDRPLMAICMFDPRNTISQEKMQGAVFTSPFLLGALRIVVEKEEKLKIYGSLEKSLAPEKKLAVIFIRRNSDSDPLCGNPTPLIQLYRQFVGNVTAVVEKEGGFKVFTQFEANTDWMNYAAVVREVGSMPREIGCAPFKEFSILEWDKKMADISSRASMGQLK